MVPPPLVRAGGFSMSMGELSMNFSFRFRNALAIAVVGVGALCATAWRAEADAYIQTNLVSDIPGLAAITDLNLKNPWGVSFGPTTPVWVSEQGEIEPLSTMSHPPE